MANQTLYPDGTVFTTAGLTGTVDQVNEAPNNDWLTANASNSTLRASFATPQPTLNTGAGLQTFRVYVRKNATGGGDPTVDIHLYENGTDLGVILADTLVTSATGQWVTATWSTTSLTAGDGSNVEIFCDGTKGGGGPNERRVEFDSIEWITDFTPNAYTLDAASGSYAVTGSAAEFVDHKVLPAAAGSYTYTGSDATLGKGVPLSAEAGSYSITGSAADFLLPTIGSGNNTLMARDTKLRGSKMDFGAVTSSSGFTSAPALSDLQDSGTWSTAATDTTNTTLRISLSSLYPRDPLFPYSPFSVGYNDPFELGGTYNLPNRFSVYVRRSNASGATPTYEVHLIQGGTSVATLAAGAVPAEGTISIKPSYLSYKWFDYGGGNQDRLVIPDDHEIELRFFASVDSATDVRNLVYSTSAWFHRPRRGFASAGFGRTDHVRGSGNNTFLRKRSAGWETTYIKADDVTNPSVRHGSGNFIAGKEPTVANLSVDNVAVDSGFGEALFMWPLPGGALDPDYSPGTSSVLVELERGVTYASFPVGGGAAGTALVFKDTGEAFTLGGDPAEVGATFDIIDDSGTSTGGTSIVSTTTSWVTSPRILAGYLWSSPGVGDTTYGIIGSQGVKYYYLEALGPTSSGTGAIGSSNTLLAESGSYSVAGSAAELDRSFVHLAEAGSYAYSGADANFSKAVTLQAEAGSYAVTGSDAIVAAHRRITTCVTGVVTATFTAGAEDSTKRWFDDANAYNGSTANYAYCNDEGFWDADYENRPVPVFGIRYATFELNTAIPTGGAHLISKIRYRAYISVTGTGTPQMEVSVRPTSQDAGTTVIPIIQQDYLVKTTPGWTDWVDITSPCNGWGAWGSWDVEGPVRLIFAGQDPTGTMTQARLYAAEIEVTYADCHYSIDAQVPLLIASIPDLAAEAGSYSVIGSDVDLTQSNTLLAETGSYTYTGQPANTLHSSNLDTTTGAYSYTGVDAGLNKSYVLGTHNEILSTARFLTVASAKAWTDSASAVDGSTATYAFSTTDGPGGFASKLLLEDPDYTGPGFLNRLVSQVRARLYSSVTGSGTPKLDYFFYDPNNSFEYGSGQLTNATPEWSAYQTLTPQQNVWTPNQVVNLMRAEIHAYDDTGAFTQARSYQTEFEITRVYDQYRVVGSDAALKRSVILLAEAGSYTYSGINAEFTASGAVPVEAGSYVYTGTDADLQLSLVLEAEEGSYAVAGQNAALNSGGAVQLEAGTYSITGSAAGITVQRSLQATSGSYTYTGESTGLLTTDEVPAEAGSYAVAGQDAALTAHWLLQANTGAYSYTGSATAIDKEYRALLATGAYTLTGINARLQTPTARRIFVIG